MYEAVKGAIPLAVRTPAQHAALDDNTAKITGFFNDALMASQTVLVRFHQTVIKETKSTDMLTNV